MRLKSRQNVGLTPKHRSRQNPRQISRINLRQQPRQNKKQNPNQVSRFDLRLQPRQNKRQNPRQKNNSIQDYNQGKIKDRILEKYQDLI